MIKWLIRAYRRALLGRGPAARPRVKRVERRKQERRAKATTWGIKGYGHREYKR